MAAPKRKNNAAEIAAAREALWRQGVVHWLLYPHQKDLYDSYQQCQDKVIFWNCSRRLGKSTVTCVIAIEECLKTPNTIIKYCCAKQVDAKGIIRPLIRDLVKTCPTDIRPEFKAYEKAYVFPNGSRIEISGLDGGRAESLRGGSAKLAIIDEAGLVGDLKYIIKSIILPTTTTTKGKIILATTPPKSSSHESNYYYQKSRLEGNCITKTVYEASHIDKEELEKIIEECGGVDSVEFRREYLAEWIVDNNRAIIPEFSEVKKEVVKEWARPPFYDSYVSMDLGLKDLTVVLFAYFDFRNDKLIIEDEFVINGQKFTTEALAAGIRRKEAQCFTDPLSGEQTQPYMRISDNNLIVINDLFQLHGLHFLATRKDDSDAALNNLRMMVHNQRIIINPRCQTLISHLENGIWNKQKSSFDRSADGSHYDAIDALKYLVRNVQFSKNPFPSSYGLKSQEDRFNLHKNNPYAGYNQFSQIFNLKGSKR
jgi:hypothetical protein